MAYTSERYVPIFMPADEDAVRNGSVASSLMFKNVADNQHWLAFTDTHAGEFINTPCTSCSITFDVPVAPGANVLELYFLATVNASKPITNEEIVVTAYTTAKSGNISAEYTVQRLDWAQWAAFNGPVDDSVYSARRVNLFSSANREFRTATITVDIDSGCTVYYAYYLVVPGRVY